MNPTLLVTTGRLRRPQHQSPILSVGLSVGLTVALPVAVVTLMLTGDVVAQSNGDVIFRSGFEAPDTPPPQGDGSALNDTGLLTCSDEFGDRLPCNDPLGTDQFPGQDAEHGRDALSNDPADGIGGFSFTKLDANGQPLADQSVDYGSLAWPCVRDEVTGAVWEVKTADGGLRDRDATYSWYNDSGINDSGFSGQANGGSCNDAGHCDTAGFVAAVNSAALCGRTDWRLPSRGELLSIVHYGAVAPLYIDADYFWNTTAGSPYWSSTSTQTGSAKTVSFRNGSSISTPTIEPLAVRLISGGQ